ncbi:hypothetical protein M4S82_10905 [Planococcus sp. MERTA32b]|nr:hypothetical protein [Planococcus sp. MER TA 32b]
MKNAIGTVFIFLGAGLLFYLFRTYSYLVDFIFIHSIIDALYILVALIAAIWAAVWLDQRISGSRFQLLIHSSAVLLMCLFIGYQMFASHFYSEEYLKDTGLEKVERLFEIGEMNLSPEELRVLAEEVAVDESAYVLSVYGGYQRPEDAEEFEVRDFKRSYYSYEMVVGVVDDERNARYYFTRDGLDFKISGNSVME